MPKKKPPSTPRYKPSPYRPIPDDDKCLDGHILGGGEGAMGYRNPNVKGVGERMLRNDHGEGKRNE